MTGEQIRQYRKDHNLSQEKLAEELSNSLGIGYTKALISYMENGAVLPSESVSKYIAEKGVRTGCDESFPVWWTTTSPEAVSLFKSGFLPEAKRLTQEERVLEYITEHGSITTWDAFADLGITRLSAKIFDLTRDGYEFDKKVEKATNRYGKQVHFTRYSLRKDNGEAHLD